MEGATVPALGRGFAILDLLAKEPGLSFTEIHKRLGLPKSSAHHLVASLVDLGMLQCQADGGYVLGLRLFELGAAAAGQRRIDREAHPVLTALAWKETLTCHLGVLEGHQAVYLSKVECDQEIKVNTWIGKRLCLNRSALGKALIAWLPDAEIAELATHVDWEAKTAKTIGDVDGLRADLALVRQRGWALDDEEDVLNIRCIAAPVHDEKGRVIAAISAVGTVLQMVDERLEPLAAKVIEAAAKISAILHPKR
jgi:DNA-binding IclR family transcriptional regulator